MSLPADLYSPFEFVIPTLSEAEGEGSAVRRQMQIPHFVRDDNP